MGLIFLIVLLDCSISCTEVQKEPKYLEVTQKRKDVLNERLIEISSFKTHFSKAKTFQQVI